MAGGMVINLGDLEQFIATLQRFDADLADSAGKLSSSLQGLAGVWRDVKFQEFADRWSSADRAIQNYLQESPRYVRYLQGKAVQVDRYLH